MEWNRKPTHIGDNPVSALGHNLIVVPRPELSKSRQSSNPHPYLEVFIFPQVRESVNIAVRVFKRPVRWRKDIARGDISEGGSVILLDAAPGDTRFGEVVRLILCAI